MATAGTQGQTSNSPQPKRFTGWRLIVAIIGIVLILAGVVIAILGVVKVIPDPWSAIAAAISGGLGLIIALLTWLYPVSPDSSQPDPPTPSAQPITVSPTITVQPTFT